jgi:16S rRNA (cytidine1402-2'-O)-methyltransferase
MTNNKKYGNLYIVATPLGNLKDITLRALEILAFVDKIICEDTRVSSKLLNHYDIKKPLISYNTVSEHHKTSEIITILKSGLNLALISDAGTPVVSDPGYLLLKECYKENIKVIGIPGSSALTLSISVSPLASNQFAFLGFLDKNKTKQMDVFNKYKELDLLLVFYESPNRLLKTLENIKEAYGYLQEVMVARELTKLFEEVKVDVIDNIINHYTNHPPRGEIVILLKPSQDVVEKSDELNLDAIITKNLATKTPSDLAKYLSKKYNLNKTEIYKKIINIKNNVSTHN